MSPIYKYIYFNYITRVNSYRELCETRVYPPINLGSYSQKLLQVIDVQYNTIRHYRTRSIVWHEYIHCFYLVSFFYFFQCQHINFYRSRQRKTRTGGTKLCTNIIPCQADNYKTWGQLVIMTIFFLHFFLSFLLFLTLLYSFKHNFSLRS